MSRLLLLTLFLVAPIANAADCGATWTKDDELQDADTNSTECRNANGKRHGRWELRQANGDVGIGEIVDGKVHGRWEHRSTDGTISTGNYLDRKKHGRWETRLASGAVAIIEYKNGKEHGQQEIRLSDGSVHTGEVVDGEWHGQWEERDASGNVETGDYVGGERHGQWVGISKGGEIISHTSYKNGELHGVQIMECPNCSDSLKCKKRIWKDGVLLDVKKCD